MFDFCFSRSSGHPHRRSVDLTNSLCWSERCHWHHKFGQRVGESDRDRDRDVTFPIGIGEELASYADVRRALPVLTINYFLLRP